MKCKTCKVMGEQCPMCESEAFMDQIQYERLISITIAHWLHNIVWTPEGPRSYASPESYRYSTPKSEKK